MSIVLYIYHCDLKVELFSSTCDLIFWFFWSVYRYGYLLLYVKLQKDLKEKVEPVSFVCFMQNCPGEILSASYISLTRELCLFGNSAFSVLHQRYEKNKNNKTTTKKNTPVVYQQQSFKALLFSWDVSNWIK